MQLDRRSLGAAALLGTASLASGAAAQQPAGQCDTTLRSLGFLSPDDPQPEVGAVGSGQTRPEHVRRAFRLLWDCPRTDDHMAVARYFQGLTRNEGGKIYNQEWPEPEVNPLIAAFFGMTSTLPNRGDQTSWCAAFASFVLYAAGKKSKFTASALGYRDYGAPRSEPGGDNPPQPGDITVFRWLDEAGAETGFGHVGFFVSESNGMITLLGGNQRGQTRSSGAVTESTYARRSLRLPLVGCYAPEPA